MVALGSEPRWSVSRVWALSHFAIWDSEGPPRKINFSPQLHQMQASSELVPPMTACFLMRERESFLLEKSPSVGDKLAAPIKTEIAPSQQGWKAECPRIIAAVLFGARSRNCTHRGRLDALQGVPAAMEYGTSSAAQRERVDLSATPKPL